MKTLLAVITAMSVLFSAHAEEKAPDPLTTLKETYEEGVTSREHEHQKSMTALLSRYSTQLDIAISTLKAKGDPEPVIAATAERVRFEKEKTVPNPPNEELPQTVQDLQSAHHKAVADAQTRSDQRVADWTERYVKALDRLMRKYTGEGKMDLAMAVKEEKVRVDFILGEIGSRQPSAPEVKPEQLEEEPEALTHTIRLSGSAWKQRWRKQSFDVPKGWKVTIAVEPKGTSRTYSHDSLRVRLGEAGAEEHAFDSNGKRNWLTKKTWRNKYPEWRYDVSLELTASEDCSLYFWEELGQRLTVTVKLEPPE